MAEIFDLVRCSGFLKPAYDGIHLKQDESDPFRAWFMRGRNGEVLQEVRFEGERELKQYYVLDEHPFRGVIVGWKDVTVSADIVAGRVDEDGELKPLVMRDNKEVVRCAVVYYSNCRKHLVPEDRIVEKVERV